MVVQIFLRETHNKNKTHLFDRYGADPIQRLQTVCVQLWTTGWNEKVLPPYELEEMKLTVVMCLRKHFGDISTLRVHKKGPAYFEVDRKKTDGVFKVWQSLLHASFDLQTLLKTSCVGEWL